MRTRQQMPDRQDRDKDDDLRSTMRVVLIGAGLDTEIEIDAGSSIHDILVKANIHPSTVIVSYDEKILPHNTLIDDDLMLELIIVSSGG